jgi:hypothetical protein
VRRWFVAVLALGVVPSATSATAPSTPRPVPLPRSGNISIARLTIVAKAGKKAQVPRLRVTSRGALPAETLVVGGVARDPVKPGRFSGTIALFNRPSSTQPDATGPTQVDVQLPSGYVLTGQDVLANVLYQNNRPVVPVVIPSSVFVLTGAPPPKIMPRRLLSDARKLALDETAPVADIELLGFDYVAASIASIGGSRTSFAVTIAIANLSHVNALQLTFPAGITVVSAAGPPLTGVAPAGKTLQLIASKGLFNEATPYRFTFVLDHAPPRAGSVTLQASTHYFENVLPFTERLYVPA